MAKRVSLFFTALGPGCGADQSALRRLLRLVGRRACVSRPAVVPRCGRGHAVVAVRLRGDPGQRHWRASLAVLLLIGQLY